MAVKTRRPGGRAAHEVNRKRARPSGAKRSPIVSVLPETALSPSLRAVTSLTLPAAPLDLDLNSWPNVSRGKYHPSLAPVAYRLMLMGLTEEELAEHFGITPNMLCDWKRRHAQLKVAITLAGDPADADVVVKLRECALGYTHPEEKVFCTKDGDIVTHQTLKHYPPNPVAAMMYLSNRQRHRWKNATSLDHTSSDGSFGMFVAALRAKDQALEGEFKAIASDDDPPADGPVREE